MNVSDGSIPLVLEQHVDDASVLHSLRTRLAASPHAKLHHLSRFDDRLAAHLDGLSVAGTAAWQLCSEALQAPTSSAMFVAASYALENRQDELEWLLALSEAALPTRPGLISALGWVERDRLPGIGAALLGSRAPHRRLVGLGACSLHRIDPGISSGSWIHDADATIRQRALRLGGELGRQELISDCVEGLTNPDPEFRLWAAWSAVLLGNRTDALQALMEAGLSRGSRSVRAFRLFMQAMARGDTHNVLQRIAADVANLRRVIEGSGIAGDPSHVPWLIGHMSTDQTARLAGEAFSLIAGADLAWLDLERKPPENFESGPNDNSDDPNVDMDPDDGLPWPDPVKVKAWWDANSGHFEPGQRYFMGAPVTREHCIDVLKGGYQRQRILAAHYLCLLNPGTPLFNTSAPAWRQQKLLAQMK
jgi:uncharacterized protein (TIGR02270 family)